MKSPHEIKLMELDEGLMLWEAELNEAQEALDLITGPDYDPENDPDPEYHNHDISQLEDQIFEARKNIESFARKIHILGRRIRMTPLAGDAADGAPEA